MSKFYDECIRYFDNHNIKYVPDKKNVIISIPMRIGTRSHLIFINFDDDGDKYAHLWWISEDKVLKSGTSKVAALVAINGVNKNYKWVKFYYDDDDDTIVARDDAIVDLYTVGEECLELVKRMAKIVDNFCDLCDEAEKAGVGFTE